MSAQSNVTVYSERAFRAAALGPLPRAPEDRIRFGEELQPVGSYAEVIPYLSAIQDAEALQDHEQTDPEFNSKDWWWDHQRIRFLNEKLGLKVLILLVPMLWILTLVVGGTGAIVWGMVEMTESYELPAFLHLMALFLLKWVFG